MKKIEKIDTIKLFEIISFPLLPCTPQVNIFICIHWKLIIFAHRFFGLPSENDASVQSKLIPYDCKNAAPKKAKIHQNNETVAFSKQFFLRKIFNFVSGWMENQAMFLPSTFCTFCNV